MSLKQLSRRSFLGVSGLVVTGIAAVMKNSIAVKGEVDMSMPDAHFVSPIDPPLTHQAQWLEPILHITMN